MAPVSLMEEMRSYTTHEGAMRGWEWERCDCIGLLFRVLRRFAGCTTDRADYIPEGLSYHEAVKWLADTYEDPLIPYLLVIETDAGLAPPPPGKRPNIILMSGGPALTTSRGNAYPISPVPGLAFQPDGMPPYVFGEYGFESVTIPRNDIVDLYEYRL